MEFPLGFPAQLEARADAAVLKACRKFPGSHQLPLRLKAGMTAFAEIVIGEVKSGELAINSARYILKEFPRFLMAEDQTGGPLRNTILGRRLFREVTNEITRSAQWIRWMEQLDATTKHEKSKPKPTADSISIAEQLQSLRLEARMTIEALADAIKISSRSVKRHLSGQAIPRKSHIAEYERVFSEHLKREIRFQNVT